MGEKCGEKVLTMRIHLSLITPTPHRGLAVAAAALTGLALAAAPRTGLALAGAAARPAASFSFTVDSTADSHDAHPGDGVCADSQGRCTLRAAREEASAHPAGSTSSIPHPAGTDAL